MALKEKAVSLLRDVKTYWSVPPKGKYMTFKEISAYSFGGVGAYLIMTLGNACLLSTGNTLISSTLGVDATDMYWLYVISVLANIPLTGIRANIIDNTRRRAGKYRPYIVSMAIPTAILCILMVWFPYSSLERILGDGLIFGETRGYVAKCAIILLINFGLQFVYWFFYDGYENLIHVLSPNTQERAEVSSIKSIVYSAAPTIVNLVTPLIASNIFHSNMTDIRVYRLLYPILGVAGILLSIVVYKNTEEKIVKARTHVAKIRFFDALRAVAKNKYFWIISFAGWIGFLETAYVNILTWLYNYGGVCSGNVYGIIVTIYGNASLWGMILAPFWIKRSGKKRVLVVTNLFNIAFILMLLPVTLSLGSATIWLVLIFLYLNAFMGSFALILNPAIQADIRDYQQYKTGERIDGMFSAVGTIGTLITLGTSAVLPVIYEKGGITKQNAAAVTSNPEVLSRVLGDGKTVGQILTEQLANGQNSYENAYSALYDPDVLLRLLHVLILVSALGAALNVIPFFWYDFNEKKQKSVINALKVRAAMEDFSAGAYESETVVEARDLIARSRELAKSEKKEVTGTRKQKRELRAYNDDVDVARFVVEELEKFGGEVMRYEVADAEKTVAGGLEALERMTVEEAKRLLAQAKAMPKDTPEKKEIRAYAVETARRKKASVKAIKKAYAGRTLETPDVKELESVLLESDETDGEIKELYATISRKNRPTKAQRQVAVARIKALNERLKELAAKEKRLTATHSSYDAAAKPYTDALKLLRMRDAYLSFEKHFSGETA